MNIDSWQNVLYYYGILDEKGIKMPSKAYTNFQKNIVQVNRLIETYDRELRGSGRGKKSLDHLTRAGLMFLCSSFEVYVESVVKESGNILIKHLKLPGELPASTKQKVSESVKKAKHDLEPIIFYDDWKKYFTDMIYYDTKSLNTPKLDNIKDLLYNYFGIAKNDIDGSTFPFSGLNDIISVRGEVAHNIYTVKYLTKTKLVEYNDTIKSCVLELDKLFYKRLPSVIKRKPWNDTY